MEITNEEEEVTIRANRGAGLIPNIIDLLTNC